MSWLSVISSPTGDNQRDVNPLIAIANDAIDQQQDDSLGIDRKTRTRLLSLLREVRKEEKDSVYKSYPKVHTIQNIGQRKSMEDYVCSLSREKFSIHGVFDGHSGHKVAEWAASKGVEMIVDGLNIDLQDTTLVRKTIKNLFAPKDSKVTLSRKVNTLMEGVIKNRLQGGSTACLVLLSEGSDLIYAVNLGDSRAVLFSHDDEYRATRLTFDHRVEEDGREHQKLIARGGRVEYVMGALRVNGEVNITRALGDIPLPLKRRPQISMTRKHPTSKFIIVASDGFWDSFHEDVLADHLSATYPDGKIDLEFLTRSLMSAALVDSRDNISLVIVEL